MYEIDKQRFGTFIAQLRKEKGYTQQELAEKLYISNKAVSKWETGVSIPDVALLIPLSEILDVTVAELLKCQRLREEEPLDSIQVEDLVKKAITYPEDGSRQKRNIRKENLYWFLLFCGIACAQVVFMLLRGYTDAQFSEALEVVLLLCPLFGFYFMVLAKEQLPPYFDEYRINAFSDGPLRMNIPGIRFNNRNWPHILKACRTWSMGTLASYPTLHILMTELLPEFWVKYDKFFMLVIMLGGLFLPIYILGKKYE